MAEESETQNEEHNDQELMVSFYECSDAAFEVIASRWWGRLFSYFRYYGETPTNAEEMAQDTLVRLFQTKEKKQYDVQRPFKPFLYAIAQNRWKEEARKRARRPKMAPLEPIHESIPARTNEPPDHLAEDLFTCIWSLPHSQQVYILHCEKHGLGQLSHNEIAELLGKWPPQITQLSQRAREGLRKCLAAKGYQ